VYATLRVARAPRALGSARALRAAGRAARRELHARSGPSGVIRSLTGALNRFFRFRAWRAAWASAAAGRFRSWSPPPPSPPGFCVRRNRAGIGVPGWTSLRSACVGGDEVPSSSWPLERTGTGVGGVIVIVVPLANRTSSSTARPRDVADAARVPHSHSFRQRPPSGCFGVRSRKLARVTTGTRRPSPADSTSTKAAGNVFSPSLAFARLEAAFAQRHENRLAGTTGR